MDSGFIPFGQDIKRFRGYEAMYMIRKGQAKNATTYLEQVKMIEGLFGVVS